VGGGPQPAAQGDTAAAAYAPRRSATIGREADDATSHLGDDAVVDLMSPPASAASAPAGRGLAIRPAAAVARRTVGEAAAAVQVALGAAVVLATADRRSLLSSPHRGAFTDWFAGPLRGLLPSLTRNPATLKRDLEVTLLVMFAVWAIIVVAGAAVRPSVVIPAVVALQTIFLLCPPFALTDIFNYIGYARLDAVHHLNPYVDLPLRAPVDPGYVYSNWHRLRSPYGPLFTLLLLPIARLPLPAAYWTYKALATAASLGLLAAVWACARRLGRPPAAAVAFVGLNPVVLVYGLGGKHNDLLMLAFVMAGGLLLLSRREVAGGAALAAAVAIKASAGLLAPVMALAGPRRWRAVAGGVSGGLVLAFLSLLAFGPHLPDLGDQDRLVSLHSFPNLIGYALGRGGADAGVRAAATVVLVAGVAACAVVAWRRRSWPTPAGWSGLVAVVCVSWLMPWYVLWALPFAALSPSRVLRSVVVVMTAWLILFNAGLAPVVVPRFSRALGRTPVARENAHFEQSLLDNPRAHHALTRPEHRANRARP
jgi:Glycosyltransferase family 87